MERNGDSAVTTTLRSPRFTQGDTKDRFANAANNTPTIKKGEENRQAVRLLQQALIDVGFPLPDSTKKYGSPDGLFGNETRDAVIEFQRRQFPGKTPDAKVGRETLTRLDELLPMAGAPLPPLIDLDDDIEEVGRSAVLGVLKGPHITGVHFVYRGQEINWGWFWKVKQCIEADEIGVLYDPIVGDTGLAVYNPKNNSGTSANKIIIPRINLTTWKSRSVLLHECVHAIQDVKGLTLDRVSSEAAAYLAQNIYHRLATGRHVHDSSLAARTIHEKADPLAQKVIATFNPTFSEAEMLELENAIRAAGYRAEEVRFDGV